MFVTKAVALVFSARSKGNCYDFTRFMLDKMDRIGKVETEVVNLCDYKILLCRIAITNVCHASTRKQVARNLANALLRTILSLYGGKFGTLTFS